jgi:RTX calcium-binding nonapeptide repeat (4 copies)
MEALNRMHRICLSVAAGTAALATIAVAALAAPYQAGKFDLYGNRDLTTCAPDRTGTDSADRLVGGTKPSELRGTVGLGVLGLGGDDTLTGAANGRYGDCLRGGNGADRLVGGPGNDDLFGDNGADRIDGGKGNDSIAGGDGADVLVGGDGDDQLDGEAGPDVIRGGPGDDWITGGAERNRIDAGPGDDRISSANEIAETVRCGSGRDHVWADPSDRLVGCEIVHRIKPLYPTVTPRSGGPKSAFHASIIAPFTTEIGEANAAYVIDVPVHPKGSGCARMTLGPALGARYNRPVGETIRSERARGFCRGLYRGTIIYRSDNAANCPSQREAKLEDARSLDGCETNLMLGHFTFRVR